MIGNVVGSYKVTEKIGEGGMGAVFKGIDLMLEREVAIKMLRPELASQPQVVERFRSEAVTLARLNHPNIATLYSFLRQGEDFFMVMEFVRGETLESLIRRYGAMPCDRAIALFCQALEGIDHAHRGGIVHRDIKPANMMLTENGTLKVMDFGIARVLGSSRMTKQGNIVGTIAYMSPEQVRGQETDARSDIYSLGILLYEMLTGRVPFSSDSEYDLMKMQIESAPEPPRVFAAHIPPAVEQAIMRSLAKRIEARFQNAAEFRSALMSAAGSVSAPPPAQVVRPEATQLIGTPVIPPSSSTGAGAPGETRVVTPVSQPQFDPVKQTRLAPQANQDYPYPAQPMPAPVPYPSAAYQQPAASKSNAKIFIGIAAAVIIVLVGTAAALLVLPKKPTTPPASVSPRPAQPSQTESSVPPPTTPNAGAGQPPIVSPAPPQSAPPVELTKPVGSELSAGTAPVGGGNTGSARNTKSAKKESSGEAAARKEKERKAAEARRLLNQ